MARLLSFATTGRRSTSHAQLDLSGTIRELRSLAKERPLAFEIAVQFIHGLALGIRRGSKIAQKVKQHRR